MSQNPSEGGQVETWLPVDACTLPTVEQPLRLAEFDALFRYHLQAVERSSSAPTAARLLLAGDATLADKVQRLAVAETACCSFFSFTIEATPTTVALGIEVPAQYTGVLAALVDRAELAIGEAR